MNLLSSIKTSGSLCNSLLWMCCVSRHFFCPFSVYDGGLSLIETLVRNPANAYQSRSESIFHLAIVDYFSSLKELWGSRIWGLHMEYQCCRPRSPRTHSNQFSVRWWSDSEHNRNINVSITFLAVYRSDSRTYDLIVLNEKSEIDHRSMDIEEQCDGTFIVIDRMGVGGNIIKVILS